MYIKQVFYAPESLVFIVINWTLITVVFIVYSVIKPLQRVPNSSKIFVIVLIKAHFCVSLIIHTLDQFNAYLCSNWITFLTKIDSSGFEKPKIILWTFSFGVCPISGVSIERSLPPPQVPFPGSRVDLDRSDTNAIAAMESEEDSVACSSALMVGSIISYWIS